MSDPCDAFRAAILAALGHAPDLIEPDRFLRFPTSERRRDGAGWCKLFADRRGGVFGCYRRGIAETWSAADRATMTRAQRAELARQVIAATAEREARQRVEWAANARRIAETRAQCVPLSPGDPCARYLSRRGLGDLRPLPEALRLHPALPYWDGADRLGNFPAMVAPVVAPDGCIVALHRTFLTPEGRKADVPTPKKLTRTAGPLAGACIPLARPLHGCLGIAEGIETALAASCASEVPTVAAYCAGNLAAWRWPAGLRHLVIFGDADAAGRAAADRLRARALAAGLRCDVLIPATEGADWCDVYGTREGVLIEVGGAA